ncbi:MAG: PHP domain-containing protein [Dehalococcoidia bacterium]|nr:PHP domain-containing protein [Dehalococcoidia bacterium]
MSLAQLHDIFDGTRIDLHVHTTPSSSDSMLKPEELVELVQKNDLTAVSMTEHDFILEPHAQELFRQKHKNLLINFGMEVSTDSGHMLVFGLPSYISGIRRLENLRKAADEHGAFIIIAHPFRRLFDPVTAMRTGEKFDFSPEEAAEKMEVFKYVDAIEVANGSNTPQENYFALEVANILGLSGTGGSDAHSTSGIGTFATIFSKKVQSSSELLEELHKGDFHSAHKNIDGKWVKFVDGSLE